jgi:drug/metabolite transporter (DMT)-like permease
LIRRASPHTLGVLTVAAGITILSVDSLLIRLLAQTLSFTNVIFWRGVGTAIGFAALAWLASPRGSWRAFIRLGRSGWAVALLNLFASPLFVIAITHTTVAHALVIIAAAPVLTAILAHVLLHERAGVRIWVVSIVIAGGVCLIFLASPTAGDLVGDIAAVLGALVLSLNLVVLRQARHVKMMPAFAMGGALTAVLSAPFVTRFTLSPGEAAWAFLMGVVVLPVSLAVVVRGLRYLQAPEVSLLILFESVLGPLWVLLALHERPDLRTILSGLVILSALAGNALTEWVQLRRRVASEPGGSGEAKTPAQSVHQAGGS